MDRDGIVGGLVGVFGVDTLCQGCERIGQTGIFLHLLAFLRCELLVTRNVFQCFVEVDVACRLIQKGTAGIEFRLHAGEHIVDSRERDDLLSELCALLGVCQSFVVGLLLDTDRLCGDAETRAVHQCHHVLDEAHACVAAELCLRILIDQFAGRRAVDAEFVFDVAHVNASVALVIDEHGQSASVTCTLFRTCKDEVDVGISVGDETLHAVQSPAVFLFVEGGLEHDTLEVGSCIRLSEVH